MKDIAARLRATTEQMACTASVDMSLWDKHSNACLEASDKIEELRKDASAAWAMCSSISAENEKLRAALVPFAEQVGRPVNIYEHEGVRMAFVDQDVLDRLCRAAAAALKETE